MAKAKEAASNVIYTPLEGGDPHTTECNGYKFVANVPKQISDPAMLELISGNPWFTIDGKVVPRVRPSADPVPPPGGDAGDKDIDHSKMIEDE